MLKVVGKKIFSFFCLSKPMFLQNLASLNVRYSSNLLLQSLRECTKYETCAKLELRRFHILYTRGGLHL